MALTIQNATGTIAGANSYTDVATFRTYCADRGLDVTGYADGDIDVALVLARDYMDVRHDWYGARYVNTQETEWPRRWIWDEFGYPIAGLPIHLIYAQIMYAYRALTTVLMPDPTYDETGRSIRSKTEKIGPVEEQTEYEKGGFTMPAYPAVDEILYTKRLAKRPRVGGIGIGTTGRA